MAKMLGYYARMTLSGGGAQFIAAYCCPGQTPHSDKRIGRRRIKRREHQQLKQLLRDDTT